MDGKIDKPNYVHIWTHRGHRIGLLANGQFTAPLDSEQHKAMFGTIEEARSYLDELARPSDPSPRDEINEPVYVWGYPESELLPQLGEATLTGVHQRWGILLLKPNKKWDRLEIYPHVITVRKLLEQRKELLKQLQETTDALAKLQIKGGGYGYSAEDQSKVITYVKSKIHAAMRQEGVVTESN